MCKSYVILVLFSLCTLLGFSQSNALDMDGGNDHVTVTNASSLISSTTNMSMTFWVYPTNSSAGFPNFDGFAGFRNNSSADFYILQLSSTTVEARFRNSGGTNYDISGSGLALNTWQHYALTYNGTTLALYRNGSLSGSISATGNLSSSTETFYLGLLKFGTTNFYLDGKIDDASLWSKALSASEVNCIYNYGIDTGSTGLELYYTCDQGNAGSTNTGLNTLLDAKSNINGNLSGFSLSGSSSNWVNGVSVYSYISGNICQGDSFLFASNYHKQDGKYYNSIPLSNGCDSIIQLTLKVNDADTTFKSHRICHGDSVEFNGQYLKEEGTYTTLFSSQYGCDSTSIKEIDVDTVDVTIKKSNVLYSLASNATYQWYNCDGDSIIPGETNATFAFTSHAAYAVIVTQNNCTDTSECLYTALGVDKVSRPLFNIFPNPTENLLFVDGIGESFERFELINFGGQTVIIATEMADNSIDVSELEVGLYFMRIFQNKKVYTEKIVINR